MKTFQTNNILIIDDDRDVLFTASLVLKGLFGKVDTIDRPSFIPEYLKTYQYDAIILDMNFTRGSTSGKEGLDWLERILRINPEACVLATTAYGEIHLAIEAMKKGAVDFLIKPWTREQLVSSLNNVISLKGIQKEVKKIKAKKTVTDSSMNSRYPDIITSSPIMKQVLEIIKTVAPTNANVLIMGENGTGKELAARVLHNESLRKNGVFVHVDIGAIPETLFEAELFGHTKGAFTNAIEERTGRFEAASGGTLFLDEIGNLSPPLQAKILTAIQNKEIIKIGSNRSIPINVRLISATNMPLYQMSESFEFRQDLLYRINTIEITIPPLRERKEDISQLSEYYLDLYTEQYEKKGLILGKGALDRLEEYHWPGNIRELAHAMERAVILCKSSILGPDDFNLKVKPEPGMLPSGNITTVEDFEKKAINTVLHKYNGNLSKAAEELGMARSTLYRKIAHFERDH